MGRFVDHADGFRGPLTELVLSFGGLGVGRVFGGNVKRGFFLADAEPGRPQADAANRDGSGAPEDLGERGVVGAQERGESALGIARILFPARFEFPGQSFAKRHLDQW